MNHFKGEMKITAGWGFTPPTSAAVDICRRPRKYCVMHWCKVKVGDGRTFKNMEDYATLCKNMQIKGGGGMKL